MVNWDIICDSKRDDGMDFRNLSSFNQTMLGKQVCCIIHYPDTVLSSVLKPKYFPNSSVLDSKPNANVSFHGKVLVVQLIWLRMKLDGEWGMARILAFGRIIRYLEIPTLNL